MGHGLLIQVFEVVSVLLTVEAGTVFVDAFQLPVTHNLCIGVIDFQTTEQCNEGCTLGWGTGIFGSALLVEAALVADADGMGVVMAGMSTDRLFRAADVELAVTGDVVVVATAVPSFGTVHVVEHLERQMLVRPRGCTVNNNKVYSSHLCLQFTVSFSRYAL